MSGENENFVSRWSRRKQQVAKEENDQDTNISDQITVEELDPEQLKAEKLETLNKLTDEDMPNIASLNEDSDFSGFMSTSVSEGLRRMALKKMFMGKSFNIRDGLDDYDDDYTKFEKMPANMITSDMKHMIEVEAKRKLAKEKEEERQKLIASGEWLEEDGFDELDESAVDEDDVTTAEASKEYLDNNVNVNVNADFDGFDTTVARDEDKITNDLGSDVVNDKNDDEEVA